MRRISFVLLGLLSVSRWAQAAPPTPAASAPPAAATASAAPASTAAPTAASAAPAATPSVAPSAQTPAADATAPTNAAPSAAPAATETKADASGSGDAAPSGDSFTASNNEESNDSDTQHRLDIYGFADFTYQRLLVPSSNVWTRTYPSVNSFAVGNFNVYMSGNLGDSWRALAEVRFLYLPNGSTTVDSSGNAVRTDTTVLDYAGFEEPIRWGGIMIERVYIEHEFNGLFKIQAGEFLTPYGIWNVDHGSPTIIGIKKPFVVSAELFPEQQTGLHLYGSGFIDPFEIGYDLTLSNGRGPVEYEDFNDDKAFGGRVYGKTDAVGSLTVGGSFYRGGYYDRSAQYVTTNVNGVTGVDQTYTTTSKYQELSLAADVKWEYKDWTVQGEIIENEAHFSPGGRPKGQPIRPPQGFQADYRRWGTYGLVGYRLPVLPLMPYVLIQHSNTPDQPNTPPATAYEVGVNLRPTAAVVVKLEYQDWHFSAPGAAGFGAYPLRILASQVAWAF